LLIKGRPVGRGWVEFHPVEGTTGIFRVTPLNPDGSFDTDGVPVGTVGVRLAHTAIPPNSPYRGFERYALIVRKVRGPSRLVVDLDEELKRLGAEAPG
jgi:hypothetical protein